MSEQQPLVKNLIKEALDLSNQRFDEVFRLIWEGTSLRKGIISCQREMIVYIPKGVQKTSWGDDLVDFIFLCCSSRFRHRILYLTEDKLNIDDSGILRGLGDSEDALFQGKVYKSSKYEILEMRFELQ